MSKDSLKERLKQLRGVAIGLAATVAVAPAPAMAQQNSAQNNGNDGNKVTLTQSVSSSSVADNIATISFTEAQAAFEQANSGANQDLLNQATSPIKAKDRNLDLENAHIGNLNKRALDVGMYKRADIPNKVKKQPKVRRITPDSPDYNPRASASYTVTGNVINMQVSGERPSAEELDLVHYNERAKSSEYHNNNPVAQNATYLHELGHWNTYSQGSSEKLRYPADMYRNDRLDEKRSIAIEYLYIANQYSMLKQQGLETYEVNGEKLPLDNMLEFYPGIKDYVKENGFDARNEQQVRDLAEMAGKYWDKYHSGPYQTQHYMAAIYASQPDNLFDCVKTDTKTYDEVANMMMTGVYIGHNTYVNLPRDVLDNCSHEDAMAYLNDKTVFDRRETSMTFGEVAKLNDYYESKGIHSNKEKDNLLRESYESAIRRSGGDIGVEAILLENNNTKTYADGLVERQSEGSKIVVAKDGTEVNLTNYDKIQALRKVIAGTDNSAAQNSPTQINQNVFSKYMQANMLDK